MKGPLPLQGVRILEFCWVMAGPYGTMLLARLGAEVIKVEGHGRTDLLRRAVVWPLPEAAPKRIPLNEGMSFNSLNLNKKSVTLDLTKPEGVALAKRLAALSDVVVDNMRPDAMTKIGLDYETLRRLRPDIIVASSSSRGRGGPESDYLGYAFVHHGIGGGAHVTGYPDDHPSHVTADVDLMNATGLAYAIVAALYHRARTGEGQFIDYSQCEGVSSLMGELLLGYELDGEIPERMGNAHPRFAPHGVYRCWGSTAGWRSRSTRTRSFGSSRGSWGDRTSPATPASRTRGPERRTRPSSTESSRRGPASGTATGWSRSSARPASPRRHPVRAGTSWPTPT